MAQCDTQQGPYIDPPARPTPGGGGSAFIAHMDENLQLDKTWQEIHDAMLEGPAFIQFENESNLYVSMTPIYTAYYGDIDGTGEKYWIDYGGVAPGSHYVNSPDDYLIFN